MQKRISIAAIALILFEPFQILRHLMHGLGGSLTDLFGGFPCVLARLALTA